jgi:2-polyprenyl-3-methyl-5-hydroxy-6-metoxy-1,4-benzoquinol methylase
MFGTCRIFDCARRVTQVISNESMSKTIEYKQAQAVTPWQIPWPSDELEHVSQCPVCESADRQLLHDNLVDNVFFVAAGRWQMYRCMQCRSAYLDPRPDAASIGKAYETYYTHAACGEQTESAKASARGRLKTRLSNGYVNHRYGTARQPASAWGIPVARLFPRQRQKLDAAFRYLPKPRPGQKLLDIGCGNGDFLVNARDAGWDVAGIDPDPKAVANAVQRGFDVSVGSVESLAELSGCFDAITISHVLEHVHRPRQVVQAIARLLKPGGVLYVDTPNIDSYGAKRWGPDWRGLETPRHLVLFNLSSLIGLLEASGFGDLSVKRRTVVRKFIYLSSLRMQHGGSPYEREPAKLPMLMRIRLKYASVPVEHDEFLTLVASRK